MLTMKFLKFTGMLLSIILIAAGGCLFYAFKIEPYLLTVNEYYLTEQEADSDFIKIVQFSDVHIKEDFTFENLNKAVSLINKQNPDIVVFTGDLYDNYANYHDDVNIITTLKKIEANYGKIAIWGNRDYGGGAVRQYENIMKQSGFTLIKNENLYVTVENDKKILFTGLDDSLLGNVDLPKSTKGHDSDYDILLTHESDPSKDFQKYHYPLTLSGHSHGGQINVPFLPVINRTAVSATALTAKYTAGMYPLALTNSQIYVNTGIGTTHISARFGVVPEISVFYLSL